MAPTQDDTVSLHAFPGIPLVEESMSFSKEHTRAGEEEMERNEKCQL